MILGVIQGLVHGAEYQRRLTTLICPTALGHLACFVTQKRTPSLPTPTPQLQELCDEKLVFIVAWNFYL